MQPDSVYHFNRDRWEALVKADALFSRPWLTETKESALCRLDPSGLLGDVAGKDVLCLAGGGGQQSVAFALNGARISVFDISEGQLQRDQQAAHHYGYSVCTFQGDMRDLGVFNAETFDIVSQPYSLNFVPDCREVFAQVARVLRPGGLYSFWAANPFASGLGTKSWNGTAYEIKSLYEQGQQVQYQDEAWVFPSNSSMPRPPGPQEYRQLLSTLINGLVEQNFHLLHINEEMGRSPADDLISGEWDHFTAVLPPWISFLAELKAQR
jgi:ubiquinone/menaquinone biosynthesis C-methylase UbiE